MNKTALKKFAMEARVELLERVEMQARKYGLTNEAIEEKTIINSDEFLMNGKPLTLREKAQRNRLISRIGEIGFDRVMEDAACTWFTRLTALRFMEVNDYLPTKVRVLSSNDEESNEPEMMKGVSSLDLALDKEYVHQLTMNDETEALFKYLILKHCEELSRSMPFMFGPNDEETEILFPDGLLAQDSIVRKMTDREAIPESNWEEIEVIGWLYQYYIATEKDRVFKAGKKYTAEEIPFVTQLFTPDWIVRYMVQNALGKKWIESHPEHEDLKTDWEFYLENEDRETEEKLAPYINHDLRVEDIKCFDPAMGSGHMLVYMFDVLYEIYRKCGYREQEIPRLVIENNLYGLDIDHRMYQLASFSVVMKAMEYNKCFLESIEKNGLHLNVATICETNAWTEADIAFLAGEEEGKNFDDTKAFIDQYKNAKCIGSLIKVTKKETSFLEERYQSIKATPAENLFELRKKDKILSLLPHLIRQTKIMRREYDVVVTNPPYMGSSSMNEELTKYLRKHYPDSRRDLFAAFMEMDHYVKENGFYAAINQHSWMFLSSFEKLREKIIGQKTIDTMLHLGPRAFKAIGGEVVQSTAFVLRNALVPNIEGTFVRLVDERTAKQKREKALEAVQNPAVSYRYSFTQQNAEQIPGTPIAYWISNSFLKMFADSPALQTVAEPRLGMATANNNAFLRLWHEVDYSDIKFSAESREAAQLSGCKWFPYNKGGAYRKWYGNAEYVVDWENDGERIRSFADARGKIRSHNYNLSYIFRPCLTWSALSSGSFGARFSPCGFLFDNSGSSLFTDDQKSLYVIQGFLTTKIVQKIFPLINPTLNYQPGTVGMLPMKASIDTSIENEVVEIVEACIDLSKQDWDSFEKSWDFKRHPLIDDKGHTLIETSFKDWERKAGDRFTRLKEKEEKLNRIFIDVYELQDELTPEVNEKDITIRKADLERDIKSFISYAIGCTFGRYSLDEEGLTYAGGEFDPTRYETFPADQDNILPILPGVYFENDIVSRFVEFVRVTFGEGSLKKNLDFVAEVLKRRKNETARETLRRYFMNDFFKDHLRTYNKRPIYWQFISGKEKAFNCLIYMHRYDETTLSRIRTDYLHEYQIRLEIERQDAVNIIDGNATTTEMNAAKRELTVLDRKIDELKKYDERLRHLADMEIEIDLDDGVKVNYEKFEGVVAEI